ncbi:MAG: UDP-N-acetylmuramoyl-L-alanyl-D-glutamate--2,6-diaminopimelate ligase, partial [candidate division Zixibacteria bacterium]|nr:UDP-N-acetylmuramoyl-L-alanyl-D-glutamate--2,6-diaminopimelate ligase [candidate division Zixibacteria bacterium]
MKIQLKELIKSLKGIQLIGNDDIPISGIEYDSRRIKPGMLFAAINGYKMDGKSFIPDAVSNGAVAILTDRPINSDLPVIVADSPRQTMADLAARFYDYPGEKMNIIGVTGTNGKSTSVYLIKKILETAGQKTGMLNSLTYDTTDKVYKAERTTPESVDVQKFLYEMKQAGCKYGVVEVSSHALVLNRVENIGFKVGLFTTFSRDHLDFHHTMEEYLAVKKLFLKKLEGKYKCAVINNDAPEFAAFADDAKCPVVTYSTTGTADVMIRSAALLAEASTFELMTPRGNRKMSVKLLGRYNLSNMAGAAAVGLALQIDLEKIVQALEAAKPVPGRFHPVNMGQPFTVLVDYAHTP